MKKIGIAAATIGVVSNFALFLTKLYVGISSNSLAIYCDAVNNLGDTFACIISLLGFILIKRYSDLKSLKAQSLMTFVISLVIGVSGAYFVYNGLERLMYPLPVNYTRKYAIIIVATIFAKILMGIMYYLFNKREPSSVLKALALDCILDCFVTSFALMSIVLVARVNFAVDGIFAILTGTMITISAIRNVINESKFLINN